MEKNKRKKVLGKAVFILAFFAMATFFTFNCRSTFAATTYTLSSTVPHSGSTGFYAFAGKIKKITSSHFVLPANISHGKHILRVKIFDKAGNMKSRKVEVNII